MDLTPLDLRYQEFPTAFRGYQKEAVRAYLAQVAEVVEASSGKTRPSRRNSKPWRRRTPV